MYMCTILVNDKYCDDYDLPFVPFIGLKIDYKYKVVKVNWEQYYQKPFDLAREEI